MNLLKNNRKVNLSTSLFYFFLSLTALLIFTLTINVFITAFSYNEFHEFSKSVPQGMKSNAQITQDFRFILILRYILNVIILMFLGLYSYFAYHRIKIGYGFIMVWTVVLIGTVLNAWFVKNSANLWFKIWITCLSTIGLIGTFKLVVELSQSRIYHHYKSRFGSIN